MGNKPIVDLTGRRFGRLKVKEMANYRKGRRVVWTCECDCGNIIDIPGINQPRKTEQSLAVVYAENMECLEREYMGYGVQ